MANLRPNINHSISQCLILVSKGGQCLGMIATFSKINAHVVTFTKYQTLQSCNIIFNIGGIDLAVVFLITILDLFSSPVHII